jgi:hypothetical protein
VTIALLVGKSKEVGKKVQAETKSNGDKLVVGVQFGQINTIFGAESNQQSNSTQGISLDLAHELKKTSI